MKHLKELISSDKCLIPNLPLTMACDASAYGLEAILAYKTDKGEERPIAYVSRTLTPAGQNYSQLEKRVWHVSSESKNSTTMSLVTRLS